MREIGKRTAAVLLAGILAVSGAACGNSAGSGAGTTEAAAQTEAAEQTEAETAEIETAETEAAETEEDYEISVQTVDGVTCASAEIFAMDTYMSVTCYGEKAERAVRESLSEIRYLDDLLSVGNPDSEIALINENGSGQVSGDTAEMIEEALAIYEGTGGAFDITIYPMMVLWGFTSGDFAVPDQSEIDSTLTLVGSDRVEFDEDALTVTLGEGQGIDLGGIAKGFTSNRLMEIFEENELTAGLVSLGGNVQCYSTKIDGTPWRCGIQDPDSPEDSSKLLGILKTADRAVITSGGYERYFEDESTGKRYHHIIDPATGYPADSGLTSVTIVSRNGMLADALSTSCYIMGLEKSIEYWRTSGEDFDMILFTEDGTLYVTEGIYDDFSPNYPCEKIE